MRKSYLKLVSYYSFTYCHKISGWMYCSFASVRFNGKQCFSLITTIKFQFTMPKQRKVGEAVLRQRDVFPPSRHQREVLVLVKIPHPRVSLPLVDLSGPPTSDRFLLVPSMGGFLHHPLVGGQCFALVLGPWQ